MRYISTRGLAPEASFAEVLMNGLAPDGGLYVPKEFPKLPDLKPGLSYIDIAHTVLLPYVSPDMSADELRTLLENTYTPREDGFDTADVTPLVRLDDHLSVLELFRGPTLAFKDVALQFLGQLFNWNLRRTGKKLTILGATSGDTGSAAIEGCRHAAGARVHILYPHGRPSDVQRKQMTTVASDNIHAIAVQGSFDDCQAIVKALFNDPAFRARQNLTAVNSINWARIMAQTVYYVHTAYRVGGLTNFVVPTGNFGNIYAAYVARKMGAPIGRLVVASNRNDILARFLETGTMTKRDVEPSLSPSMDIQVSSNFERLLFDLLGQDADALKTLMDAFAKTGTYTVDSDVMDTLRATFMGGRADDDQTLATITRIHDTYGYTLDPHTAVGFYVYEQLKDRLDGPTVALACAHPAKFPEAVTDATGKHPALPGALADLFDREEHFTILPNDLDAIRQFILSHNGE